MPIHGQCPACGRTFQAPDKLASKRVKCPKCSAVIQLGSAAEGPTAQRAASGEKASQTPTPAKHATAETAQWHLQTADGQQFGPVSKAELDRWVAEGRLDGSCQLCQEGWEQWKWAEAVYPEVALSGKPESQQSNTSAGVGADSAAAETESRIHPCPDCGQTVSKRASRCPHCGCPLATAADQAPAATEAALQPADEASSAATASQKSSRRKRNQVALFVAGAVSAVLLVLVLGFGIGWYVWKKSHSALEDAVESLTNELPTLEDQAAKEKGEEDAKRRAATREEMEQCMKEASAAMAREIDGLYRKVHVTRSLFNKTQERMDLIQSLLDGDLAPPPKDRPVPPPESESDSYQSQYDSLYDECLTYVRKNISEDESDRSKVWNVARGWAEGKKGPLEKQMAELLEKQLGL